MRLANARPLDIAVARQRVATAAAQLDRAYYLWLPTIYVGIDYFHHDGPNQDTSGNIIDASRSSFMAGAGPSMVFAVTDAYFAPAGRQASRRRAVSGRAGRGQR